MTRCRICHDPLPGDGPTCESETCDVAWEAIKQVAGNMLWAVGDMTVVYCRWCNARLGHTTQRIEHDDDCLHKRAAALLASRGMEDDDG